MSRAEAEGHHHHLAMTSVLWVTSQAQGCQSGALPGWEQCAEDLWSCRRLGPPSLGTAQQFTLPDGWLQNGWFSNYPTWCCFPILPSLLPLICRLLFLVHTLYHLFVWVSFLLVSEAETPWEPNCRPCQGSSSFTRRVPPPSDPSPPPPPPPFAPAAGPIRFGIKQSPFSQGVSNPNPWWVTPGLPVIPF